MKRRYVTGVSLAAENLILSYLQLAIAYHKQGGLSIKIRSDFLDFRIKISKKNYSDFYEKTENFAARDPCRAGGSREPDPFSVVVLGNFRRFFFSLFHFFSPLLDFSHIYNKFLMPFVDFFY